MAHHPINNSYQDLFHIPDGIYLASHAVGCLPKAAQQTVTDHFFTPWKNTGTHAWHDWLDSLELFRRNIAGVLHGKITEICPQVNISVATYKILSALPLRANRQKIIISTSAFPSTGFALSVGGKGIYEMQFLENDTNAYADVLKIWEQVLQEDVQLILLTHATSTNSFRYPITEILQMARAKGIYSIVDVAQTVGVLPIHVNTWNADFVVGSSIKWLCGGPGAGFLWANENSLENFEPKPVGWFSHKDPFEFDVYRFEYAKDARRFWGGTPSVIPFVVANEGIKTMLEIGIESIYQHNQLLSQKLISGLQALDLSLTCPVLDEQRGPTVTVKLPNPAKAQGFFTDNHLSVDYRGAGGFRLSPHIYNSSTDIDTALKLIANYLQKNS